MSPSSLSSSFPKNFLFGAATSSHQIEGNLHNNWTEWEKSKPRREELLSEGKNPEEYMSKNASYHAQRMKEDVEIMSQLNLQVYRFSIEWSRIEPKEGKIDQAGIDFYDRLFTLLKEKNITPFVTLWHWSVPVWLEKKGGLISSEFTKYFQKYVDIILPLLKKHSVENIITFNEPLVFSGAAYQKGLWPPQKKSLVLTAKAVWNLIKTHKKVYTQIHTSYFDGSLSVQIGVAKHNIYFHTETNRIFDAVRVRVSRYIWNEFFLDRIKKHQDFIGINYYFRDKIENGISCNPNEKCSDLGWELYPKGVAKVCEEAWERYKKPVYITEHGLADSDDSRREWYICESLKAVQKSIENGVDIRGYMHWSLLDNFEWAEGFGPCFGLVSVDYENDGKRTIRGSAKWYAQVIKTKSILI